MITNKITGIDSVGLFTIAVSPGRRLQIGFDNPDGHEFSVVGFLYDSTEASRVEFVIESGLTSAQYLKSSTSGFAEVGVRITTDNGNVGGRLEVLESQL